MENSTQPQGILETPEVENIKELLKEGAARIEGTEPVAPLKKKDGRGRPLGRKNKNKVSGGEASRPASGPSPDAEEIKPPKAPPGTFIPLATTVLTVPSNLAAENTGYDGFRFTQGEIDQLAPQLDLVLIEFLPVIETKYGALVAFALSLMMISFAKFQGYQAYKRQLRDVTPAAEPAVA